jgi:serine/threonine protein kinase
MGTVLSATYCGRQVAVKMLHEAFAESDPVSIDEFKAEIKCMRGLRHANIVFFYGAGQTPDGVPFLVVEFMPRGPLSKVLHNMNIPLSFATKVRFAVDIAKVCTVMVCNPSVLNWQFAGHALSSQSVTAMHSSRFEEPKCAC